MRLSQIEQTFGRAPGRKLILEPWVFADEWADKPKDNVCIGIRLMPEGMKAEARRKAEEIAAEMHANQNRTTDDPEVVRQLGVIRRTNVIDAFNDALMRLVVAFAVCDVNDATQPWSGMRFAEDEVHIALTSRGVRFIYEAIERYEVETSPLNPPIEDEEVDELVTALDNGALSLIAPGRSALARRFLRYALDELRTAPTRAD